MKEKAKRFFYKAVYHLSCKWDNFCVKCQRFKRGYSYGDARNIERWFCDTVKPMLEWYLKTHHGTPCELEAEEWDDIIGEMILYLGLMKNGDCLAQETNKNKFFELFSKWFFYLWD